MNIVTMNAGWYLFFLPNTNLDPVISNRFRRSVRKRNIAIIYSSNNFKKEFV